MSLLRNGRNARVPFLVLAVFVPLAALSQAPPSCTTAEINAPAGPICGFQYSASANAYLGIPYAQAPTPQNNLRWKNPVALAPWTTIRQATQYGNMCPQATILNGTGPDQTCTFSTTQGFQSEDCLYLNVWTPTTATPASKLPVMVFIPGGAYHVGSGGSAIPSNLYDGTYLASSGNVIVVTFNYRLGVLGFLATRDMQSEAGNFGFRDQLMALSWVQQNIASFGGDPRQVLLFGESAGGISVGLHAVSSPQSAGLFKAALMESNTLGVPYKTLQQAQDLGAVYESLFQCSDLQCLQQLSACELVAQEMSPCLSLAKPASLLSSGLIWTPVIDGSLITGQPLSNAGNLKVPMLMGTNGNEGVFFADKLVAQSAGVTACPKGPGATTPDYTSVKGYAGFLDVVFEQDAPKILGNQRYSCSTGSCFTPLANVITDSIFTCPNRHFATQAGSAQNIYMYLFGQVSSFDLWGSSSPSCLNQVCHGAEIPYVFNTAWASGNTFQPAEETLSRAVGGYWVSFAKSQSPGNAWPLFKPNKTYMLLSEIPSTANDLLSTTANCSLWDSIGYLKSVTRDRLKKAPAH